MKTVIALLAISLLLTSCENAEETKALYSAWCKAHQRQDLSLEEWSTLRSEYMLPGQSQPDTDYVPVVIPIHTYK